MSDKPKKRSGHDAPKRVPVMRDDPQVIIGSGHLAPAEQPKGMVPPPKRDDSRDSASPKK